MRAQSTRTSIMARKLVSGLIVLIMLVNASAQPAMSAGILSSAANETRTDDPPPTPDPIEKVYIVFSNHLDGESIKTLRKSQ